MDRITWIVSPFGTEYGRVNKITLFEISDLKTRGARSVLRTNVPGYKEELASDTDRFVLKSMAETVLERFVERIGATFPDPEPEAVSDVLRDAQDI